MTKDLLAMKDRALSGDPIAAWQLANALIEGCYEHSSKGSVRCARNVRMGLLWLEYAANHGCAPAMLELGSKIICNSLHGKRRIRMDNIKRGLGWEKKAWRHGEILAPINIAITYSFLSKPIRSFYWIEKAYVAYREVAMLPLAKAYLFGFGVKANVEKAKKILRKLLCSKNVSLEDKNTARSYLASLKSKRAIVTCSSIFTD